MERALKVFLCHSSVDKAAVRELYRRLISGGVKPWLDEEDLLPGQDWQKEIPRAVSDSDAVIVCLSRNAVNKAGYVQKEIQYALDVASKQPEGAIFLVPVRLEDCVVPGRLQRWHWVDLFQDRGYERLERALAARLASITESEAVSGRAPEGERVNPIGTLAAPAASTIKAVVGSIQARLKRAIVEQLVVDEDEVTLDASFVEDLGADSLDIVELVMAVEEEFGIEVPDEILEKVLTVRDALEHLEANVSE